MRLHSVRRRAYRNRAISNESSLVNHLIFICEIYLSYKIKSSKHRCGLLESAYRVRPYEMATNLKRRAVFMRRQTANAGIDLNITAVAILSVLLSAPSGVRAFSADTETAPATAMVSDPCPAALPVPDILARTVEGTLIPGPATSFAQLLSNPDVQAYFKATEERAKTDWPNLCKYRDANAAMTTPPRVVFIGDSITESWVRGDPQLFRDGVIGRGISGQTSPQILLRFFQDVIELRPRVVHIMAGTNDIAGNTGPTTEQDFKNNIIAMIDLARAHHIQVAVASILPAGSFSWKPGLKPAATIVELNSWLRGYAQKSHIRYVDYYAVLADSQGGFKPNLSNDGVHPNRDGYAAMKNSALLGIAK
jgi:lysophospholipase L1-like esterase